MELEHNSYHLLINWLNILEANSVKVLYFTGQRSYFQFQARDITDHLYFLELPESSVYNFDSAELEEGEYIRLSDIKFKTKE